jgi:hypothetical protein
MRKRFDQDRADKYDSRGKVLLDEIVHDLYGYSRSRENHGEGTTYAEGFWDKEYLDKDGKPHYKEVEIKEDKFWNNEIIGFPGVTPFRYDDMDIPERKFKNRADEFFVVNQAGTLAWRISREVWLKHRRFKTKDTVLQNDEDFWTCDTSRGEFLSKTNGTWHPWKETQ